MNSRERWPGGYIHRQKDGRPLFIIERQIGPRRFHVSTKAHSLRAAMKQLESFEANPGGYDPGGAPDIEALVITPELVEKFRTWMLDEKGNSRKHTNHVINRLADWAEDLGATDLRRLELPKLYDILDRRDTERGFRMAALKVFCTWLRKRGLLNRSDDRTLDLAIPQAVPEKRRRRKAVEIDRVRAAFRKLDGRYRDVLLVMAATGWHVTELERFIRREDSHVREGRRGDSIAALVVFHKKKEVHPTPITDPEVLEAAKRLRADGRVPKKINDALKEACRQAGVPEFTFGVMRHTVATWADESGADFNRVSKVLLGHKDERTSRKFYADVAIPHAPTILPSLRVVSGGKKD